MTGVIAAMVGIGTAAVPTPQIEVVAGYISGNVTGGTGFLTPIGGGVTFPGDPQNQYSYSVSKVSGSSKISYQSMNAATASVGPSMNCTYTGLLVGEQASAKFRLRATLTGYLAGTDDFEVTITRTS